MRKNDVSPGPSRRGVRLSRADAAWLRMEAPTNPMVITALLLFAEPLPMAVLEAFATARVLGAERFGRRLVPGNGRRARWEPDADFAVRRHLHHVALPHPGDERQLEDLVSDLMSSPLDTRKPPWEMHLIDGFLGGSAVVVRLHHSIADGVALVRLMQGGADAKAPSAAVPARDGVPEGALVRGGRAAVTLAHLLALPGEPATSLKGPLGAAKRGAWSRPLPLRDFKEIAARHGVKVGDVFATIVAGGLRRYLDARRELASGLEVRAVVPVNLRRDGEPGSLGNRFGLAFLSLPLGLVSPDARLDEVARRTRAIKTSGEALVTYGVLESMALVSPAVDELVIRVFEAKATLVMTTVPGPRAPISIGGRRLQGVAFWAPQAGRLGLGVSMLSYAGDVRIGVASDVKLVAEPAELVGDIETELTVLRG